MQLVFAAFLPTSLVLILYFSNKRYETEMKEIDSITAKLGDEFRKTRHTYNNMIQQIVSLIEANDLEGLNKYKDQLLENTRSLNGNNFLKLSRLNDKTLQHILFDLVTDSCARGRDLELRLGDEAAQTNLDGCVSGKSLRNCIFDIYEKAFSYSAKVILFICITGKGTRISFEYDFKGDLGTSLNLASPDIKLRKKGKKAFLNTFAKDGRLVQEIIIPF